MVGTSGYGFMYGDPYLLLTTWDANGNGCGFSNQTKDYPFLYFPTIDFEAAQKADPNNVNSFTEVLKFSTCVKECPSKVSAVQCLPPAFIIQKPEYYKDCAFYMGGVQYGKALRYDT